MQVALGTHIIQELYDCDRDRLSNETFIRQTVQMAQIQAGATILSVDSTQFDGGGASQVQFLAESHISIHTWPEYGYQAVDVYTCGDHTMPEKQIDYIVQVLHQQTTDRQVFQRGILDKIKEFSK